MIVLILFLSIFFWFIRKLFKSNRLDENYRYDNVNYSESYREQLSNQRHSTVLAEKSTIHGYITENLDGVEIIFSLKEGEQRSARDDDGYGMRHILHRHQKDLKISNGKEFICLLEYLRLVKSEETKSKIALYYGYDYYKKNIT